MQALPESHCMKASITTFVGNSNAIVPMTIVASARGYLLATRVELGPNAQAEARATGTDTQTGKKPALWPVASSASLGARRAGTRCALARSTGPSPPIPSTPSSAR
jgi:hypothetical protein